MNIEFSIRFIIKVGTNAYIFVPKYVIENYKSKSLMNLSNCEARKY